MSFSTFSDTLFLNLSNQPLSSHLGQKSLLQERFQFIGFRLTAVSSGWGKQITSRQRSILFTFSCKGHVFWTRSVREASTRFFATSNRNVVNLWGKSRCFITKRSLTAEGLNVSFSFHILLKTISSVSVHMFEEVICCFEFYFVSIGDVLCLSIVYSTHNIKVSLWWPTFKKC